MDYECQPKFQLMYLLILDKFVKHQSKSETFCAITFTHLETYDISLPVSQYPFVPASLNQYPGYFVMTLTYYTLTLA